MVKKPQFIWLTPNSTLTSNAKSVSGLNLFSIWHQLMERLWCFRSYMQGRGCQGEYMETVHGRRLESQGNLGKSGFCFVVCLHWNQPSFWWWVRAANLSHVAANALFHALCLTVPPSMPLEKHIPSLKELLTSPFFTTIKLCPFPSSESSWKLAFSRKFSLTKLPAIPEQPFRHNCLQWLEWFLKRSIASSSDFSD